MANQIQPGTVRQIEIDELYVGLDKFGCHFVIPVQAKGGTDQISIVQTRQDMTWCKQKYPELRCRPISAHFITSDQIALFEADRAAAVPVLTEHLEHEPEAFVREAIERSLEASR